MGGKKCCKTEEDPELEYLRSKAQRSLSDVINEVLENEAVKKAVSRAVIKQSLEMGISLSFLIVGITTLFNAFKNLFGFGWQGDLAAGTTLIIVGASYLFWKLKSHT